MTAARPTTIEWEGFLTARSSISHGGDTRGTITLLRHETVIQPDGRPALVPIGSGNAWRGHLRRVGEELLRDTLDYAGHIPLAAAHALRGGGALAKTSHEPLSGRRLLELRRLVPHVGVFGCAAGGRIISGCLQVGKLVPLLPETHHLLPPEVQATLQRPATVMEATQVETYGRADETDQSGFAELLHTQPTPRTPNGDVDLDALHALDDPQHGDPARGSSTSAELEETGGSRLMQYRVQTWPAGTRFHTWLRLQRPTDLEAAFFTDVLQHWAAHGRYGGRASIGHGLLQSDLHPTITPPTTDWRAHLREHRDEALHALRLLT